MEKKYVVVETNEPISIGDTLACDSKRVTSFGVLNIHQEHLLTEDNVDSFVKMGVLKVVEDNPNKPKDDKDLKYYTEKLAKDLGMEFEATVNLLERLTDYCPRTALSLMLNCIEDDVCEECTDGVYFYIALEQDKWNIESCYIDPCSNTGAFFDTRSQAERAAEICSGILNAIYEQ